MWLDALRGLAAFMVILQHWRYMFFCDLHEIPAHRALYLVPYVVTSGGRGAVIVFFVLSGFLVGSSALRSFERDSWGWRRYLTHRFVRLWVVLLPALLLGWIWDETRLHLASTLAGYGGTSAARVDPHIVPGVFSLKVLFANALFLQGDTLPTFGSNGPLWSLSYEFWYYILFPLALCGLWSRYRPHPRILSLIGLILTAIFVEQFVSVSVLVLFPAWLAGASLHFAPRPMLRASFRWVATMLFALCFFCEVPLKLHHPLLADYSTAIATGLLLWVLTSDLRVAPQHRFYVRASRAAARFSYTLYLVHLPLMLLLAGFLIHNSNWLPNALHLLTGIAVLIVVIGYAWVVATFTEFRTDAVRHWIELKFRNFSPN
ncbi:MAG: acyltransferase [Acidobacteriaceae bacterium]